MADDLFPAPPREASAKGTIRAGRPAADARDNEGHRERARARFDERGGDSFDDYELLELLLFRSLARADTKALAKALLKEFGSLREILAADRERLRQIKGVGPGVATDLKVVDAVLHRIARAAIPKRKVLSSWSAVIAYLKARQGQANREEFRILFLDKRNALIRDEVQGEGTVDHTPVYPREVVKRSLELTATAIILVHNHPSGDTTPSPADITMTREIVAVAKPLGIAVHDHVIIGRHGHTSLKSLGLM